MDYRLRRRLFAARRKYRGEHEDTQHLAPHPRPGPSGPNSSRGAELPIETEGISSGRDSEKTTGTRDADYAADRGNGEHQNLAQVPTRRLSKFARPSGGRLARRLFMRSGLLRPAAAVSASFLCVLILHTWRRAKRSLAAEPDSFGSSNISDGVGISTSGTDDDRGSGVGVGGSCAAPVTTGGATAEGAPVVPSWTTGELVRLSAPAMGLCLIVVVEERRSRHRGAVAISLPGSPFARDWPPFNLGPTDLQMSWSRVRLALWQDCA